MNTIEPELLTTNENESDAVKIIYDFMLANLSKTMQAEFNINGKPVVMAFTIISIDGQLQ